MEIALYILMLVLLVAWGMIVPRLLGNAKDWKTRYEEQCSAHKKTAAAYIAENQKLREESDKWRLKAKELYYQIISSNGKFKTDYVPPSVRGIDDAAIRSINVHELPLDELPQKPMLPEEAHRGTLRPMMFVADGIQPGDFIRFNDNEYNRQHFMSAVKSRMLYQVERITDGKIYCVGQVTGLTYNQVYKTTPFKGDKVDIGSETITVDVWNDQVDNEDGDQPKFIRRDNLDRLRYRFDPNWIPSNPDTQPTGQPYTVPTKQTDMVMPTAPPIKHRDDKGRFVSSKSKSSC